MKSIINNKKAAIGYEKMLWVVITMSLIFGIWISVFLDWGDELSEGGINISAQTNGSFSNTLAAFEDMKSKTNESEQELLTGEKDASAFGVTYKGGSAALSTFGKAITNFPIMLKEFFVWFGIPGWIFGIVATMIVLSITITLIKAFLSKGQPI